MANVKVTELTALTAADSASTDVLPVVDVSADATKKLAISDLHRSVPDGTLSAPGIAFQSDLNSGLYRSGTDAIALVTNGAARILIDATGNVTIPNDLTVEGTTTFIQSQTLQIEDKNIELGVVTTPTDVTADGGGITLKGTTDKTIQWVQSTGAWTFNQPTNFNDHVLIDGSGNVGVGTSSPAGALHVDAASGVDGPIFDSGGTANSNHALLVRDSANNQLLRVNNDGKVGIGTTNPAYGLLDVRTTLASTSYGADVARFNNVDPGGGAEQTTFISIGTAYTDDHEGVVRIGAAREGAGNKASIVFHTSDSTSTSSEKVRIDSLGRLLVGTSSFSGEASAVLEGSSAGGTTQAQLWLNRGATPSTDNVLGQIIFGDNNAAGRNDPSAC
jgi:hypothetical protein